MIFPSVNLLEEGIDECEKGFRGYAPSLSTCQLNYTLFI